MKEITAIIRRQKLVLTRNVLTLMGFPAMTIESVEGRGKQKGLIREFDQEMPEVAAASEEGKLLPTPAAYALEHSLPRAVTYVPKRLLRIVVPDEQVEQVVQAIITISQTGQFGDGRVFVSPLNAAYRVRTGETGDEAVI